MCPINLLECNDFDMRQQQRLAALVDQKCEELNEVNRLLFESQQREKLMRETLEKAVSGTASLLKQRAEATTPAQVPDPFLWINAFGAMAAFALLSADKVGKAGAV